ncbi:hypothetical protein Tco_0227979 [Tanacetum coccineum]
MILRGVAWSNLSKFGKSQYNNLFFEGNATVHQLTLIAEEMNELWRRSSLDFFKSFYTRVQTEVRREVHVRTEVHRYVDEEEQIVKQPKTMPSVSVFGVVDNVVVEGVNQSTNNVVLEGNWNGSENVVVDGLNHQSIDVDHITQVSACITFKSQPLLSVQLALPTLKSHPIAHALLTLYSDPLA